MPGDPLCEPLPLLGKELSASQRHRAARVAAAHACDAEDLTQLLDMLGLTAAEGLCDPVDADEPAPSVPSTLPAEVLAEMAELQRVVGQQITRR